VLAALAPGAVLINVGRGTAVVDADVIRALEAGRLAAAVLDVFREEPLPPGHPFWITPNLYVTPHVAAVTPASALAELFLDNLARYEAGQPLAHRVDAERGY
jgi:phosphoglycerate dehydrogenase-like enzyme